MSTRPRITAIAATATLLASVSLQPLLQGADWVAPGAGAVLVAVGAGMVVRRFRLPAVLNVIGALAALNLYLTLVYTPQQAFLWFIPTPTSLDHLAALLSSGWADAQRFASPVPHSDGLELLTVLGMGLTGAIVDLLAVRMRRAAAAGLPLLAMYSVPVTIMEQSINFLWFALGAAGYLALLVADSREHVTGWGRPVFTRRWNDAESGEKADSRPLSSSGRRVGLISIMVAVAVPAVVPGISSAGLFGFGGTGSGTGSGTITTADPLIDLKRNLVEQSEVEVLTYTTDAQRPEYLRMHALDRFNSNGRWTYTPLDADDSVEIKDRELPPAEGQGGTKTVVSSRTEIQLGSKLKGVDFLYIPYAPRRVEIDGGQWRADPRSMMVYSTRGKADGKKYVVESVQAKPTAEELRNAPDVDSDSMRHLKMVPAGLPPWVRSLAVNITAKGRTRFDKAVLLQNYFLENFTYSLRPPPPTRLSDLEAFIKDKYGYCEQFAATMAIMARTLNIPSRVAVGATPGQSLGNGRYSVKQRDSHAWPELYFDGAGWVRFEPTAMAGSPSNVGVPDYTRASSNAPDPTTAAPAPTELPTDGPSAATEQPETRDRSDEGDTAALDEQKDQLPPLRWIIPIPLTIALALLPFALHLLIRRRRWSKATTPAAAAEAAWTELRTDAEDFGISWNPSESPRTVLKRLSADLGPEATAPLTRLTYAQELARYAHPNHPNLPNPATLLADNKSVRTVLKSTSTRKTRIRAATLPPSSLQALRQATTTWLDTLYTRRPNPFRRH